jgi:O-acetyl-ADP-ribose deacetylase (regulator of RNase III)
LATGEAVITSGGKLPAKFVIHVAGPVWGEGDEDNKLRRAIRNSLLLADEKRLKSVAFPAISTGIYGFPVERGAKLMLKEGADYLRGDTGLARVIFCLFGEAIDRAFEQALAGL